MDTLHIDEHIIVVNKPAGLAVLPDGWEKDAPYLVKMLEEEYGKIFIVHRLDTNTTGAVALARSKRSGDEISRLITSSAEKRYLAVCEGRVDAPVTIDSPMSLCMRRLSRNRINLRQVPAGPVGETCRMHIRDWPAQERPREKLLALGSGALSEAELLAIWLRHGTSRMNAIDLARSLLGRFGSLRGLLTAGRQALCAQAGIGPARWAELQAALELVRRHHLQRLQAGPLLASPRAARDYLIARLRDLEHEVFRCLFLDSRHRLTSCDELFRGTVDGASVHPREVVKQALARNATAVILAHNHPSGIAAPSQADEIITTRLRDALALVENRLLDNLIIGDGSCVSLAEKGLI